MVDTFATEPKKSRDVHYFRQRYKNRVFAAIVSFFADEAERTGVTKKDIALRLKRDPAQISRWLANPGNLTLETISDLLLALDAEPEPPAIVRFADRPKPNYVHPLIANVMEMPPPVDAGKSRVIVSIQNKDRLVATAETAPNATLELVEQ